MTGRGRCLRETPGPLRLLLIGPLAPPVGGATVLFEQLAAESSALQDVSVRVINTSRGGGSGSWRLLVQSALVIYKLMRSIAGCDVVSFHASREGAALFGPIVLVLSFAFRKPWIFRGFGDFEAWYRSASGMKKALLRSAALRANFVLLETKSSVTYFSAQTCKDVRWYPNSRPLTLRDRQSTRRADHELKFVFVGHVKPSKGVRELINAAELFDGINVDVYGPLLEGMNGSDFQGKQARYRGPLEPDAVAHVLRLYDVLLLPTYYEGEGYPGVILEAYAEGLPVIASRWRSIPEMVTNESGVLVEPRSVAELAAAMQHLMTSRESFARLREGAKKSAKMFSSEVWTEYFVDLARDLRKSSVQITGKQTFLDE